VLVWPFVVLVCAPNPILVWFFIFPCCNPTQYIRLSSFFLLLPLGPAVCISHCGCALYLVLTFYICHCSATLDFVQLLHLSLLSCIWLNLTIWSCIGLWSTFHSYHCSLTLNSVQLFAFTFKAYTGFIQAFYIRCLALAASWVQLFYLYSY